MMSKPETQGLKNTINFLYGSGVVFAVLSFVVLVLWYSGTTFSFLDQSKFEPLSLILGTTGLSGFFFAIARFLIWKNPDYVPPTLPPNETQSLRNRKAILGLVQGFWVDGVLKNSLQNEVFIKLGMEERKDAVENRKDAVENSLEILLKTDEQPNRLLPPNTKIIDVYDDMNQSVLILGEPGSGKTTLLLELARYTINRAKENPNEPIPVVFNLSSWPNPKLSLEEWLVNELKAQYRIPTKIARPWVEQDELLLLFDGLDEVADEQRENCVRAINEFRQEHLVPMVICSRSLEYKALNKQLKLQGAIHLQPLSLKQIKKYLARKGPEFRAVRNALTEDKTLWELAKSPLILNIMMLVYQGKSPQGIHNNASIEARREHLWNAYITNMLKWRNSNNRDTFKKTLHWLSWLANKMVQNTQTIFFIEKMQPSWLTTSAQKIIYLIIFKLIYVLFFGLCFGSLAGLIFGLSLGPRHEIKYAENLKWSWSKFLSTARKKLWGPIWVFSISSVILSVLISGLYWGLVTGLIIVLSAVLYMGLSATELEVKMTPNQGIRLSLKIA